jgi:hypothetical protein
MRLFIVDFGILVIDLEDLIYIDYSSLPVILNLRNSDRDGLVLLFFYS